MSEIINILLMISKKMGYFGIVFLMTIESSFIPFPSEVVIPPAAYHAQQGDMNIFLVILSGIAGSLLGAVINYYLALTLGRRIIYSLANHRIAKFLLISEAKIKKSEEFFIKYGNISTFTGRLLPGIRQLISIPAGLSRMNLKSFLFFTFLGSGLWTVVLAMLGYASGANKELLQEYYREITISLVIFVAVVFIVYIIIKRRRERH